MLTPENKDHFLGQTITDGVWSIEYHGPDNQFLPLAAVLMADGYIMEVSRNQIGRVYKATIRGEGFIAKGGYQAQAAELEKQKQLQEIHAHRQLQLTDLQIQQLLDLPEENRSTRRLSKIAIGISILVLAWEIFKVIVLKEK
ncbi:hypothetical protein [Flavihumibacter petaseus]|uniref:Uncharacterized protein n=1 Tax=Flavihumibacter petaseus NBRC 106054 TaxID=1220578 RepID=A0A0E9N258_9BACT|nr:hypothetical protein [Flavihumibacter petaseus]GAO43751.1 hypothetical protein FPE01S_02_08570 [Flavihumibacter petaseus NBRC 106054]